MNTRLPITVTSLMMILLLTACGIVMSRGSDNIHSEVRIISDFSTVNFSGIGKLTIVQGDAEELTITADNDLLPSIKSTVSRGILTLTVKDSTWLSILRPTHSIHYTLKVKTLTKLNLSGAGQIYATELSADSLMLTQSGVGNVTIDDLTVTNLSVKMNGLGNVTLAGHVAQQSVEMSGLGNYQAGDLESQSTAINVSGASAATVWVHKDLDATLVGVGSVSYYGMPQTNTSMSGIGSIHSLGEK